MGERTSPQRRERPHTHGGPREQGDISRVPRHVAAITDPSDPEFQVHIRGAQRRILDVGVGIEPRSSWDLRPGDVWVGCDPRTGVPESGQVTVNTGDREIARGSTHIFYSRKAEEVPPFPPDAISVVAPNPEDVVVRGGVFNDEVADRFPPPEGREQSLVVVLDRRTHESRQFGKEAKGVIHGWARENGFEEDDPPESFEPNSADLGAESDDKESWLTYTRGG